MNEDASDLEVRLHQWLDKEGYPLEFQTASAFKTAGFGVVQGWYVDGEAGTRKREVDLLATARVPGNLLGVDVVVECKWSDDKPWVVFSNENAKVPTLPIDLAMGNGVARACLSAAANLGTLSKLDVFAASKRSVFGGRQAFAKGNDLFYDAIMSTVAKARAVGDQFRPAEHENLKSILTRAIVVLPVIVVKGKLFETTYDVDSGKMTTQETRVSRVEWQGSNDWPSCAFVDIVAAAHLADYARQRFSDVQGILACLVKMTALFSVCLESRSLSPLAEIGVEERRIPSFLSAAVVELQRQIIVQPETV